MPFAKRHLAHILGSRNYVAPSRTSRKSVPKLMRDQFKKQKKDVPADATEDDLQPDTRDEIQKKREANTLAARRSRLRKQAHLVELEDQLNAVKAEAEEERRLRLLAEQRAAQMEDRLQALEARLSAASA